MITKPDRDLETVRGIVEQIARGFLYDLRHSNKASLNKTRLPLMERNPVLFWKGISFILAVIIAIILSG